MKAVLPKRGEVWSVTFDPTRGHEQAGKRPALVLSVDKFNSGPAGLAVVLPLTTTDLALPIHIRIDPPEGGVRTTSFIMCEMIRSISQERLRDCYGRVSEGTLAAVEECLRILLGFL